MQSMPVARNVIKKHSKSLLSNTCILACQHLLMTTNEMFEILFEIGLKPENLFVLGKCYSSNRNVFLKLKKNNVNVSEKSFFYNSHLAFDELYQNEVKNFYESACDEIRNKKGIDHLIILDDGGSLLNLVSKKDFQGIKITGIEQTSSGYQKISKSPLSFPIINVARSSAKLKYESPVIAQKVSEILIKKIFQLENVQREKTNILIIGNGYIGQHISQFLKTDFSIKVIDKNITEKSYIQCLKDADIIIGCTGSVALPGKFHKFLKDGSVLISASSSDREFDSVFLRKKVPVNYICHRDLKIHNTYLLNSGFPLNFGGHLHSIDPKYIQLTRALLISAVIQARLTKESSGKILDLDSEDQRNILQNFFDYCPECKDVENFIVKSSTKLFNEVMV